MWKKQGDKFIKVAGTDLGKTDEHQSNWACHGCSQLRVEYKLVSKSRGKFGLYCGSCIGEDFTLFMYGKSNEETIKNAI